MLADEIWAPIHPPNLLTIVHMVQDFFVQAQTKDPSVTWDELRLWTMDSWISTPGEWGGVPFLATELQGERGCIAVFYLCGLFGWTAMPMAFQVVTRVIKWELSRPGVLQGLMDMYADDMFGVCLQRDLAKDMEQARAFCTHLLWSMSIEERKTESGRRLTITG